MASATEFRKASQAHWIALKGFESHRRSSGWADEDERETFQLMEAAVLYQAGAIAHFGEFLHQRWRLPPSRVRAGAYAGSEIDELPFGLFYQADERIGQMHLASAAMRLPVALQKILTIHPDAKVFLEDLWGVPSRYTSGEPDWLRSKMRDRFAKVETLGHCGSGQLGATLKECLQNAITVVTVLRDDFGHGEEGGTGPGTYRGDRKRVLDTLYTCRILETQQLLVGWASKYLVAPQ